MRRAILEAPDVPDITPDMFIGADGLADLRVDNLLRRWTLMVLDMCDGNRSWAADELGVSCNTLNEWLTKFGVEPRWPAAPNVTPAVRRSPAG